MSTDSILIFDTTLRDGEQSPGCSMNTAEKLQVAEALVELGVDVIEAGFPIASPDDFEAVRTIARKFGGRTTICGLARCRPEDIDRAWEALQDAENCRLHVFLATSPIHRQFKLKMAEAEIIKATVEMVKRAVDKFVAACKPVNAALEEVVMALRTRKDYYGAESRINTRRLFPTSQLVSHITGMVVQRNKAIVGQNAFAHEAGIHQHGMLQERTTYEIMRPEDVGFTGTKLVLGKHSGRHAFRDRLKDLGLAVDDATFQKVFDDFIDLADKKKEVYDSDIVAIVENRTHETADHWKIVSCQASAGAGTIPTATVSLECGDGKIHRDAATGGGPIEAVLHALERVIGISATLEDLKIRSVSKGKDALGEVVVQVSVDGRTYTGTGLSVDIVEGSARAYVKALNQAERVRMNRKA